MASTLEYVQFIAGQLAGAGTVTYKKLFGEYGLYLDGLYFACICDNCFLVKTTDAGLAMFPKARMEPPYAGAKPMLLVEQVEDREFLEKLARVTVLALPVKTKKEKKK